MKFRLEAIAAVTGIVVIGFSGWHQPQSVDGVFPMTQGTPVARPTSGTTTDGGLGSWKTGANSDTTAPLALAGLRRMFDHYLDAGGERSTATITQEINAEIDRSLAPPNIPKAKRLLGLYLEFKHERINLEGRASLSGQGVQAVRNRILAVRALRSLYFTSEEEQAMFGVDDAYDMDAVARAEIDQNPSLTPEQKHDKLAALDAAMPADLLRARKTPPEVFQVEEKVYAMRTQGASDDDVYRLRARESDPQTAARWADLDREEAQWTGRIAQYLAERNQLLETPETATDPDHKTALLDLQRARFTENERSRLPVYEQ